MAENKSPAFQLYGQDFLMGTLDFTAEEVGGYIRLLIHQWDKGSLPNDDKKLIKLSGMKPKSLETVKQKFELNEDGNLRNKRLEKTRQQQIEFKKSKSESGKNGANKRWQKDGTAIVLPLAKNSSLSSTSSSTSKVQQHQQSSHEVFKENLFTEEWKLERENLELQLNPRREITEEEVIAFNRHLQTEEKHHIHRSEYLKHLRNWLNTKPIIKEKYSEKKESINHEKGRNQNGNTDKIGRNSKQDIADYLAKFEDTGHSEQNN